MKLEAAVERFAGLTHAVQDADLERAWTWGDYDEGVRYDVFRTYEELRDLAAQIAADRVSAAVPVTLAQYMLGQYLTAYWGMKASLLGIDDELALQIPAEGEWPLRRVVLHILDAERTFFAILVYAVEREHSQDGQPLALSDEGWDAFWSGDPFDGLVENGRLSDIMAYFEGLHRRILSAFVDLTEQELEAGSVFWESTPMPVRFRLHRFDSHTRQHTVQIEKARRQMGLDQLETLRLLQLIYNALAEVQAVSLGAGEISQPLADALAATIETRCNEIEVILEGEFHARPPD